MNLQGVLYSDENILAFLPGIRTFSPINREALPWFGTVWRPLHLTNPKKTTADYYCRNGSPETSFTLSSRGLCSLYFVWFGETGKTFFCFYIVFISSWTSEFCFISISNVKWFSIYIFVQIFEGVARLRPTTWMYMWSLWRCTLANLLQRFDVLLRKTHKRLF